MDGLPVVIRLLDPPLHEFLPDFTDAVGQGRRRRGAREPRHRGRGAAAPGAAPARAEPDARHARRPARARRARTCSSCRCGRSPRRPPGSKKAGKDPRPEIMVPLVATVEELVIIRHESEKTLARVATETGVDLHIPIGTMIELPRAAMTAGQIAEEADFFSFGTNDLTQTDVGLQPGRRRGGVLPAVHGARDLLGQPVRVDRRRRRRPAWSASPPGRARRSSRSCRSASAASTAATRTRSTSSSRSRIDYVSCSPFRVPVARLEAGRASMLGSHAGGQRHPLTGDCTRRAPRGAGRGPARGSPSQHVRDARTGEHRARGRVPSGDGPVKCRRAHVDTHVERGTRVRCRQTGR